MGRPSVVPADGVIGEEYFRIGCIGSSLDNSATLSGTVPDQTEAVLPNALVQSPPRNYQAAVTLEF